MDGTHHSLCRTPLADLELVDWPESTKEMQRNWIGKSEGAEITFPIIGVDDFITVFTTRPDTLFGATYLVLAPEHPLVKVITSPEQKAAIAAYCEQAQRKTDLERTDLARVKTGVFTGAYAFNPATGREIPIWVADYVLYHYGTGAIMAVPAHDQRDFEFALAYRLPIEVVVRPAEGQLPDPLDAAFIADGISCNSSNAEISLDGLPTPLAKERIIAWLETRGIGRRSVRYKLRDWLFPVSGTGASQSPLFTSTMALAACLMKTSFPLSSPMLLSSNPRAAVTVCWRPFLRGWMSGTPKLVNTDTTKPTLCRSGQGLAGTTCDFVIRIMTASLPIRNACATG